MSVKLIYKDIAVGSDTDMSVSANASLHSTLTLIPFGSGNTDEYATLEHNRWVLDGSKKLYDGGAISFMSLPISDGDCEFSTAPKLTLSFTGTYTSLGISVNFREFPAGEISVAWFRGSTKLDEKTYYPDSLQYFCANSVSVFNRIEITFVKTWLPFMRVMVDAITIGITRTFTRKDLRSGKVNLTQEIDVTSRTMAANALDWTLSSHENVEYLFQLKQPVEAYDDSTLLGVFYISESNRIADNVYDISCTDAIGVLEDEIFPEAIYTNKNALALAQEICSPFNVTMDAALQSKTVSGILKGVTKRSALQQLCFAIGAVADTSADSGIKIFQIPDAVTEIPADRTRTGGSVRTDAIVTAIRLTSHSYSTSTTENQVEINGVKYGDTQAVTEITNPLATSGDRQNVVEVTDATLVSPSNVAAIAQRLYNTATLRTTHSFKFRVDGEAVGDRVSTVTPWGSEVSGVYQKANIILSGITLSSAEVIG